jgi:hypothetical protein
MTLLEALKRRRDQLLVEIRNEERGLWSSDNVTTTVSRANRMGRLEDRVRHLNKQIKKLEL